jgi:hypothetical protein
MHVQLDESGNIIGEFALPQPALAGYQKIADDDARLAAWSARKAGDAQKPAPADVTANKLQRLVDALIAADVLKTDPTL